MGKAVESALQDALHSFCSAHKEDEHENAPEDAEGGEHGARLVAGDGLKDFSPFV